MFAVSVSLSVTRLKSVVVRAVYATCCGRGVIQCSLCQTIKRPLVAYVTPEEGLCLEIKDVCVVSGIDIKSKFFSRFTRSGVYSGEGGSECLYVAYSPLYAYKI